MTDYFVYGLSDPFTHRIRYVGFSCRPEARRIQHCSSGANKALSHWTGKLREKAQRPELILLEGPLNLADAKKHEFDWIEAGYYAGWPLLNVHSMPQEVSA